MTECIIERPRHGGVRNYHSNRPRIKHLDIDDLDSLPKSEGYRRPHLDNGKELSDFLNPLYRFLLSNVGRKWNDVYSEIRQNINPNSTTQIHILDHVLTWVNVNTFIGEEGKVYISRSYGWQDKTPLPGDIYVHPITGILEYVSPKNQKPSPEYHKAIEILKQCYKDPYKYVRSRPYSTWDTAVIDEAAKCFIISQEKELRQVDGIWYWVIFSDTNFMPDYNSFVDANGKIHYVGIGLTDYFSGEQVSSGATRYRSGKRQASKKDLKKYRLVNISK